VLSALSGPRAKTKRAPLPGAKAAPDAPPA